MDFCAGVKNSHHDCLFWDRYDISLIHCDELEKKEGCIAFAFFYAGRPFDLSAPIIPGLLNTIRSE
jgi:hypothetical protein